MKTHTMKTNTICLIITLFAFGTGHLSAQEDKAASDTTKIKKGDRNVMLNAANNTGPREVNVGLPATVGGTTILENGLPVVYFFWPELPSKAWRQDATINGAKLLDLGQTAIHAGEVGFSLSTFDNLGTDALKVKGALNSNHFGLMRGDINLSGPIGHKGTKFSVGAYGSFDPGTFKPSEISRYFADKTQLYKAALTQDYKSSSLNGSVSVFYKYANVQGISNLFSPFIYGENGKVKKVKGFDIGRDSYIERSGKLMLKDAFTEEFAERDILKDYGSESHTVDLISNNKLSNNLKLNFILRYHQARTGMYTPVMTGTSEIDATQEKYVYADNTSEEYTGDNVQGVMILASKKTPLTTVTSKVEVGKKSGNHDWNIGLNQWYFSNDRFATESIQYYQEVAANPRKLVHYTKDDAGDWSTSANEYGDYNVNSSMEYYNGTETKTALYISDKWDVNHLLTLNLGSRITFNELNGDYQKKQTGVDNLNEGKTPINHRWWLKVFMAGATYKVTDKFGLLGDAIYNEGGEHLNKYSAGSDPKLKVSKTPSASIGVYFNHPLVSIVSKATFISKDQYRTTVNFSNPDNSGQVVRVVAKYKIETIGWTTDILATPVKNFALHLLVTVQSPKYKNFSGDVDFGSGQVEEYNFTDKTVTGVSKYLMEIDPSYTWKGFKIWSSARYFSKQYFNKPNTLYMAGHWETFAGANYQISKNLGVNVTFVNLLNQSGASGSIPDGDLVTTAEAATEKIGTVMAGSYIRPFTAEFGLKYQF
jgi:hypothetical protein